MTMNYLILQHCITIVNYLIKNDRSNLLLPIFATIMGVMFDASSNPSSYGKNSNYNYFADRDASRVSIYKLQYYWISISHTLIHT